VAAVGDVSRASIDALLRKYGLQLRVQAKGEQITGSYWGGAEAGIVGQSVYVRSDTPVHSLLHESCHVVCTATHRREQLDHDAGGDDLEEVAVCFLQVLLAEQIEGVGRERVMQDMDA